MGNGCIIKKLKDEDIKKAFNKSMTVKEFFKRIGYSKKGSSSLCQMSSSLRNRLKQLDIDLNELKGKKKRTNCLKVYEDRYKCQRIRTLSQKRFEIAGIERKCLCCGYDKHIEIAHIVSVSEIKKYDDDEMSIRQDLYNTIPLCPNCHWEFDHLHLNLDKEIQKYRKFIQEHKLVQKVKKFLKNKV